MPGISQPITTPRRHRTGSLGECEVSVLFADLRGYSRYVQQHRPAEVFRVLEAYASRAADIIDAHRGWVLSYHGDGLLAIFGVLEAEQKERCALSAATALVHDILEVRELPCQPTAADLPVGIGIATGSVFVGRIGQGEGATWSATGDATNVAARLQELSREYRTPIVVDARTCARIATPCTPHRGVPIRGRDGRIDVFTPLPASKARAPERTSRAGPTDLHAG